MSDNTRHTLIRLALSTLVVWAPLIAAVAASWAFYSALLDGAGIHGFFRDVSLTVVTGAAAMAAVTVGLIFTHAAWKRILTDARRDRRPIKRGHLRLVS